MLFDDQSLDRILNSKSSENSNSVDSFNKQLNKLKEIHEKDKKAILIANRHESSISRTRSSKVDRKKNDNINSSIHQISDNVLGSLIESMKIKEINYSRFAVGFNSNDILNINFFEKIINENCGFNFSYEDLSLMWNKIMLKLDQNSLTYSLNNVSLILKDGIVKNKVAEDFLSEENKDIIEKINFDEAESNKNDDILLGLSSKSTFKENRCRFNSVFDQNDLSQMNYLNQSKINNFKELNKEIYKIILDQKFSEKEDLDKNHRAKTAKRFTRGNSLFENCNNKIIFPPTATNGKFDRNNELFKTKSKILTNYTL